MIELNFVDKDTIKITHKVNHRAELFDLIKKVDVTHITFLKEPMKYMCSIHPKQKIDAILENNEIDKLIRCNYFNIYELFTLLKKYRELYGIGAMEQAFESIKNFAFGHNSDRVKYMFIPLFFKKGVIVNLDMKVTGFNVSKKEIKRNVYRYKYSVSIKEKPKIAVYGKEEKPILNERLALRNIDIYFEDYKTSSIPKSVLKYNIIMFRREWALQKEKLWINCLTERGAY